MLFFTQAAMNVTARATLKRESERRSQFAIDRFQRHIREVGVVLKDVNGPRRGSDDKVCNVTAMLRDGGSVAIKEQGSSFVAAIHGAFQRLRQVLARRLGGKAARRFRRAGGSHD